MNTETDLPKLAPHNLEAEQSVLGAVLLDNQALVIARPILACADLFLTKHQLIYRAMLDLADRGEPIDNLTLNDTLQTAGHLAYIGGASYLAYLVNTVASAANVRSHVRIVAEKARLREIRTTLRLADDAIDNDVPASQVAALLNQVTIPAAAATTVAVTPWQNSLVLVRNGPPEPRFLIHGVLPSEAVTLVSGREGVMKTYVVMDWSVAIAEGKPWLGRETEAVNVCYVDAEMPGELMRARVYAAGPSQNLNIMHWQEEGFPWKLDHPAMVLAAREHRLLIIDTLRRYMEGLDENSSNDMAIITGKLRMLTKWGAAVVVLHHGIKDKERGGYRGSTEIGANVDISMHIEKRVEDGETRLILDAHKTRYSDDPRIILRVERTQARPIFHDITGDLKQERAQAKDHDLKAIETIMSEFIVKQGRDPIQSELVEAGGKAECGSRATILAKLRDGEGAYWESYATGRTRAYRKPTCLTLPHKGVLDRLDRSADLSNLSTPPIGKLNRQNQSEVNLDA